MSDRTRSPIAPPLCPPADVVLPVVAHAPLMSVWAEGSAACVTPSCFDRLARETATAHAITSPLQANDEIAMSRDLLFGRYFRCRRALRGFGAALGSTGFRDPGVGHISSCVFIMAAGFWRTASSPASPRCVPAADPQLVANITACAPVSKKEPFARPVAAPAPADPRAPSFPTRALHDRRESRDRGFFLGTRTCSWTRTPR